MSDDRNWLADELKQHHKDHKKTYFVYGVAAILLVALAIFLINHHTKTRSLSTNLTSSSSVASNDNNGSTTVTPNKKPSISTQSQSPSPQEQDLIYTEPSSSNQPTSSPSLNTSTPKVNCSEKDQQFLGYYNTWASGEFSDLEAFENQVIPTAGTLGPSNILSEINSEIQKIDSTSQYDYGQYESDDAQYSCVASLSSDYYIPICTDLNLCVGEIPRVP